MKNNKILLSVADINGYEQKFIKEAFDTNWITTAGPHLEKFEKEIQSYLHTNKSVVALSSGTAAIHLGLIQLGIKPGDEVICQDFTFAASINPVKYLNAVPVLVDSEEQTWNICPNLLESAIKDRIKKTGRKPKAIIIVHIYGMPAKMEEIMQIARLYDIPLFEDAAEALGSFFYTKNNKKYCGTLGNYACFSFNGNKIITTAGGGALICPSSKEAEHVKFLALQAKDDAPYYQHSELGYNYRLSNINAAIGCGQIKSLNEFIKKRREINQIYRNELSEISDLSFQNEPPGTFSNYWLTTILLDSHSTKEKIRLSLETKNIESRSLWKPMHMQPLYNNSLYYGNNVNEKLFDRGLCLPSGSGLKKNDILKVCETIKSIYK